MKRAKKLKKMKEIKRRKQQGAKNQRLAEVNLKGKRILLRLGMRMTKIDNLLIMKEFRHLESKYSFDRASIEPMKFTLGGINCSNCCKKIEKALLSVEGIITADASAMTYRLKVTVD